MAIDRASRLGLRDSHERARGRWHACVGRDHAGHGRSPRGGRLRPRLHLRRRRDRASSFAAISPRWCVGSDAMAVAASFACDGAAVRNLGRRGHRPRWRSRRSTPRCWDLKATLLELPLVDLLGARRAEVPVYGSGGFTSYSVGQLREQLAAWGERGLLAREDEDRQRAGRRRARERGPRRPSVPRPELFVDANGAY